MRLLSPLTKTPSVRQTKEISLQILHELMEEPPRQFKIRFWDGSIWPENSSAATSLVLSHPGALREMLLGGSEERLAESYLRNDCDVQGNIEDALELVDLLAKKTIGWTKTLKLGHLLRQLPDHEGLGEGRHIALLGGRQHSLSRDRRAVQFHYDLSNEFYALWLDSRMVYSCAYFHDAEDDLDSAQWQKLDYICRKLDLRPGQRLLDIGCGWGGLIFHAAQHYGVRAEGITLSENQNRFIAERIKRNNLGDRISVRLCDYRELTAEESYDAVVSVGMVEHVGRSKLPDYFAQASRLLKPRGLFLNHGIGTGTVPILNGGPSFMEDHVFPDTDLVSIAAMLEPVERVGFEVRDVENLREHYVLTLRHWVRNLEMHRDEALRYVDDYIYRTWHLYMAGCAHGFGCGRLAIYQTLLSKLDASGYADRPLTRTAWYR